MLRAARSGAGTAAGTVVTRSSGRRAIPSSSSTTSVRMRGGCGDSTPLAHLPLCSSSYSASSLATTSASSKLLSSIHRRHSSSLSSFNRIHGRPSHHHHGGGGGILSIASSSSSLSSTSSSAPCQYVITNLESRRHLSPWAWRTIIGGVLGMGYVSFHFFVRSVRAQKTWIKMRLLKPKHIPPSAGPYPPFDRPNEAAVLRNYLNHPPAGTHAPHTPHRTHRTHRTHATRTRTTSE
jgi:hypothetical protein